MADSRSRVWGLGRAELKLLRRHLIDEAGSIDREFQGLALRMADVRAQLRELRDRLWPAGSGRGFRGVRRPRVSGPEPIGRPAPPAKALRGRELRYASLGVLVRSSASPTRSATSTTSDGPVGSAGACTRSVS